MGLFNVSTYSPYLDAACIPPAEMRLLGVGRRSEPQAARPARQSREVECPLCGRRLRVPVPENGPEAPHRTGRCPACQTLIPLSKE